MANFFHASRREEKRPKRGRRGGGERVLVSSLMAKGASQVSSIGSAEKKKRGSKKERGVKRIS